MYPIYPNDMRLPIDPGFDGNPIKSELGPFPHAEGGHKVDGLASTPSTSKDVWADGQLLVMKGATTEKLIPHVPVPPIAPPGPPVGLAETILKSKVLYLFNAPKVTVNGAHPAVSGLLAPPLRCQKIRLPIPAGLAKLAAAAQSKALRAKTSLEGLQKAKDAVENAKDGFDAAKQGLLGLLHQQVTGEGRSDDLMGGLLEVAEAKLDQKKAEIALAEAQAGLPNERAAGMETAAADLQRAEQQEAIAAKNVREARKKEQEARKRERQHQAEQKQHETEAERATLARNQNAASTSAARKNGWRADKASRDARIDSYVARQHADHAQRTGRHEDAAAHRRHADELFKTSEAHRNHAERCRQATRYGGEQIRREHVIKQDSKKKAKASAKQAEKARQAAENHAKAAEAAEKQHKAAKKTRRSANKALGRAVAPCVDILVPSVIGLVVANRKTTVTIDISMWDWLMNWVAIAGVIASDIINGYIGFITDTLGSFMGEAGQWAFEHVGALLQSEINVFRNWLITDKLEWVIPVKFGKGGKSSVTTTLTRDPKTGERTWAVATAHGDFKSLVGGKTSPKDGTETIHGNTERGRFKANTEWTHDKDTGWKGTHQVEMAKSGVKGSASKDYVEADGGWQDTEVDGEVDPESALDKPGDPAEPSVAAPKAREARPTPTRDPAIDATAGIPTV